MKKDIKKHVAIGIAGCLAVAAIGAALFWNGMDNRWLRYILLAILSAGLFGFLMHIFGGWHGFFSGAKLGFGFVALSVAGRELPDWGFGLVILAAVVVFVVLPLVKRYRKDREKDSETVVNPKMAAKIRDEEAVEALIDKEEAELKSAMRFGEKSLLMMSATGGMYQLIRGTDRLLIVRVGGELSGLNVELLRTDFADETALIKGKKDFDIPDNRITSIQFKFGKTANVPMEHCGKLTIQTDQKRYAYTILDTLTQKQLVAFFGGLPFTVAGKKRLKASVPEMTEEERQLRPKLKKVTLILTISSFVAGAAFMFLAIHPVVYRILSAICIIIPAATFALYVKYNDLLSADEKNDEIGSSKIDVTIPLLIPSAVLGLRTLLDFNITGWTRLGIWSIGILAVILIVLFKFTKEYKRSRRVIALIVVLAAFYTPSTVIQINALYDNSDPVVYTTELLEKDISSGKGKSYYYTVELANGSEEDFKVSPEFYDMRDVGDSVIVVESDGLLGIAYVYIEEG